MPIPLDESLFELERCKTSLGHERVKALVAEAKALADKQWAEKCTVTWEPNMDPVPDVRGTLHPRSWWYVNVESQQMMVVFAHAFHTRKARLLRQAATT
jgi:hypothetical protein